MFVIPTETKSKPYCYKMCPIGKQKQEELLKENDSVLDAVYDFECFCTACSETCQYETIRDYENPDGIEWWNLKNIERHSYGNPPELIGDIMSIERYREHIDQGYFIPYDGVGCYCTEDEILEERSDFSVAAIDKKIAKGYKYVIWCNK